MASDVSPTTDDSGSKALIEYAKIWSDLHESQKGTLGWWECSNHAWLFIWHGGGGMGDDGSHHPIAYGRQFVDSFVVTRVSARDQDGCWSTARSAASLWSIIENFGYSVCPMRNVPAEQVSAIKDACFTHYGQFPNGE